MATKEQLEIEQRYNRLLEEQEKKKETLKKLDMDTSAVDKQIKAYKDMQQNLQTVSEQIETLGGITGAFGEKWRTGIAGSFINAAEAAGEASMSLGDLGGMLKNTFSLTNLMGNAFEGTVQQVIIFTKANYDAAASFHKTTGASKSYTKQLRNVNKDLMGLGITMAEVSEAAAPLYDTFTDFTKLNKETSEAVINTSAVLQKLGVAGQTSAQSMQMLTKGMGFTATAANKQMGKIEKAAGDLGVSYTKMFDDFTQFGGEFAQFGKEGPALFNDMAAAAKSTGIEMGKLVEITQGLQTFEGAADAAGRLNALMGGDFLNSVDLMTSALEDPTQAVEQMQNALISSFGSFDDMSPAMARAAAEAAGFGSDVNAVQALMAGNLTAYQEKERNQAKEREEIIARGMSLMDQMTRIGQQLARAFEPFFQLLMPVVELFGDFLAIGEGKMGIFVGLAPAVWMVATAMKAMWFGMRRIKNDGIKTASNIAGWAAQQLNLNTQVKGTKKNVTLLGRTLKSDNRARKSNTRVINRQTRAINKQNIALATNRSLGGGRGRGGGGGGGFGGPGGGGGGFPGGGDGGGIVGTAMDVAQTVSSSRTAARVAPTAAKTVAKGGLLRGAISGVGSAIGGAGAAIGGSSLVKGFTRSREAGGGILSSLRRGVSGTVKGITRGRGLGEMVRAAGTGARGLAGRAGTGLLTLGVGDDAARMLAPHLGKVLKSLLRVGPVTAMIETVMAARDIKRMMDTGVRGEILEQAIGKRAMEALGGAGGAMLGTWVGGMAGSAIPGPGTAAGAFLGSIGGAMLGKALLGLLANASPSTAQKFGGTINRMFGPDAARDTTEASVTARRRGGPATGLTLVGEGGPEILSLPPMSNIINNNNATQMAAAAAGGELGGANQQPIEIVINIDGEEKMRKVIGDELGLTGGGSVVEMLRLSL